MKVPGGNIICEKMIVAKIFLKNSEFFQFLVLNFTHIFNKKYIPTDRENPSKSEYRVYGLSLGYQLDLWKISNIFPTYTGNPSYVFSFKKYILVKQITL